MVMRSLPLVGFSSFIAEERVPAFRKEHQEAKPTLLCVGGIKARLRLSEVFSVIC